MDGWLDIFTHGCLSAFPIPRHFFFSTSCVSVHEIVHGHACACSHTRLHMELAAFPISMHESHFGSIYLLKEDNI